MRRGTTRRDFLSAAGAAGAAGVGAALAPPGAAAAADVSATRAGNAVPFHGVHQAGIATPAQGFIHFAAFDVPSATAADLRDLLATLSQAAARMTAGAPAGSVAPTNQIPVDTGETLGLGPARLTVTFGLGPHLFDRGRLGLDALRPAPLQPLPPFANDNLQPAICAGDIGVQACADDPQVAFHAIHDLMRLASPLAAPRWSLAGFGRTRNVRSGHTPRNLMGFKDGTANIVGSDRAALERFVWAGPAESPAWMAGGSYMVVRRIRMILGNWDSLETGDQEHVFGRHKVSGAPLGRRHEFDPLDLQHRIEGHPAIPESAHVRLASPQYNQGQRLLRRGYSYTEGLDGGSVAAGQLFICFQRDPRAQFVRIQKQLSIADALNQHTEHVGSAIFACPPGAPPGGFVGQTLLS